MCPKIMTPHYFECKKATEWNMTPKQKWSHMTGHIPGKILIWSQIVTPVTSALNSPLTNFSWIWHIAAACDKIAHTVSPNHMGQIQLPRASMPLMTPFHHSTVPLSNISESRSNIMTHIFKCVQKSWLLITLSAKKQQNEIWHPNKNGLIWLGTYQVKS